MKSGKEKKPKVFKGAVLFTVLVIMVFMLIMMLTTIALAGTASKRAYSEHFDHQSMSTARSVVDSVIYSLRSDNATLGEEIVTQLTSVGDVVDVQVNDGNNLGEGFGTVQNIRFEYVGSDDEHGYNIMGTGKPIIKVTASVETGGEISTFSQYVIGSKTTKNSTSSGGGLIALGGYSGAESPQLTAIAPAYIGINDSFKYSNVVSFTDDFVFTSLLVNSSIQVKTHPANALAKGMGMSVMGNMFTSDGVFTMNSSFLPTDSDVITDLPYLYVDGALNINDGISVGSLDTPMNIYCGRYIGPGKGASSGYANIYCYNTGNSPKPADYSFALTSGEGKSEAYAKESWSCLGSAAETKLLSWAQSTLSTDAKRTEFQTGNFYTMGNLELKEKVQVDGDIYVDGDLHVGTIEGNINGNIYVKGNVSGDTAAIATKIYNGAAIPENIYNPFPAALPAGVNSFLSGNLRKTSLLADVVVTTDAVRNEFYDSTTGGFKNAVNASDGDISSSGYLVYKGGNAGNITAQYIDGTSVPNIKKSPRVNVVGYEYDVIITSSCMLTGSFQGINFYFKPTTDIWVNLENVTLNNCNILVDDSAGSVNFYLPTENSQLKGNTADIALYNGLKETRDVTIPAEFKNYFITKSDTIIMTQNYYNKFKTESNINIVQYPTTDSDPDNDWMVPDINFHAAEGANVFIKFENPITLTGDICTPGGTIDIDKGGSSAITYPATLTYEGNAMKKPVGCVGSVIVDKVQKLSNEYNIYYVNYPAALPPGGGIIGIYKWIPLEGFADY